MYHLLKRIIETFEERHISPERRALLEPCIVYIAQQIVSSNPISLNFICTHNSRRSYLGQIWAQAMAYYFHINQINCFSGGTEVTAMAGSIIETLSRQGFQVIKLSESANPIYAIRFAENNQPMICFSKKYDHDINPKRHFAAIMTCDHADGNCPIIGGADHRFSIMYQDPKRFDGTSMEKEQYIASSLEIGQEMWYIMKTASEKSKLDSYHGGKISDSIG